MCRLKDIWANKIELSNFCNRLLLHSRITHNLRDPIKCFAFFASFFFVFVVASFVCRRARLFFARDQTVFNIFFCFGRYSRYALAFEVLLLYKTIQLNDEEKKNVNCTHKMNMSKATMVRY